MTAPGKVGRCAPVRHSPEAMQRICALVAEGISLSAIGRRRDTPCGKTIATWRRRYPEFAAAFDAAAASAGGLSRGGRPTHYSEAVAVEFCARLAAGRAMHRICEDPDMPSDGAAHLWLQKHADFAEMVATARDLQAQRLGDEVIEIADAATPGEVQVARTRIAARQWMAAKLAARKAAADSGAGPHKVIVELIDFNAEHERDD